MQLPRDIEWPSFSWHMRSWQEIKDSSLFTKANYVNLGLLVIFVILAIRQARSKYEAAEKAARESRFIPAPDFPPVEEQPSFDWRKTDPIQIRPFKPKYHLTMADWSASAITNLDPNDLHLMDRNYLDRINYRKTIMQKHSTNVVNVHSSKRIRPAVKEQYTFLLGTYLPLRYPTMFKLHSTDYETGQTFMLHNLTTNELFPAFPVPDTTATTTLLSTLGRTLDEDILFLLPEDPSNEASPYILDAYVCCCPSGFNPADKLGKRLADIHAPVPGYADKLEASMDRYFAKLPVGKYVTRVNWSVTTDTDLYAAGADTNHAHEGDVVEELPDIDLDKTFLRCERQTLHRLPRSHAVVFAFKTYLYPLADVKAEGRGPELADAIDGLKQGNAPGMHFYKRGAVWGEAVKRYLRA